MKKIVSACLATDFFAELCIKAGYKILDVEDIEEYS